MKLPPMRIEPDDEAQVKTDNSKTLANALKRIDELEQCLKEARQIITDLVEYAECNDPGNPHIGKAKGFLSGGEG